MVVDGRIGIRMSKENCTQRLIRRFRKPFLSTSANISSEPSAVNFNDISNDIKAQVDYFIQYSQNELTPPKQTIEHHQTRALKP
ncbi:L-threonylcarbamoyladenylate synthase [Sunxiuqinia indica]|uniref:L-threonylcarbamoyladenylate synthase n=1 Tax=Sunxiuqinia indica TaxID=2692584 RepID=UPI0021D16B82|nr:Sua5/YciO/YrdC/YwlC family protein [Sunxiuqinia indica]